MRNFGCQFKLAADDKDVSTSSPLLNDNYHHNENAMSSIFLRKYHKTHCEILKIYNYDL